MAELEIIGQDYNCETGEITPIYLTPELAAQHQAIEEERIQIQAQEQAKIDAKQTASEKLKKLGLTDEEISSMLGI